ncbi:MAG TPA: glycosyl transferase family 1 [Acetobacteraceae bacterium]|jgi:glycosyltransferase involved in cell wall biosynthesis|nr:glycosyl transferase family 1 [Acetobacteraceae bacterium]
MHVCLIVPGPLATVSGGHTYDRRMAEGLRALGHDVQIIEIGGRLPDPDQAAIYAARTAWSALPPDSVKLIDGLALPAFDGLPPHQVTALIHHPASMETGVPEDVAQRLQTTEAAMYRDLPRLVTTSEQTAERLIKDFGAPSDRISVIVPGADVLPRGAGSAGPGCQILSIGALIPRKGHDVLMRSLSRLFDLDWHLTIAGSAERDPVHASQLQALADELNIVQRVHFTEDVSEALWAGTDLFALTSYFEGYGVAIAEAMRRGIAVAVTNVGAVPTLVGPEAGIICAPGDLDQYSKALRRLIFDRALRRDMSHIAWEAGQALPSWNEQAARLAAVLAA